MEDLEASLRGLQQRVKSRQEAFAAEFEAEKAAAQALQRLRARAIENRAAFDAEDVERIDECIAQRQRRLVELEREHEQRRSLRHEKESLFQQLQRTIAERSAVLEAEDAASDVLRGHAELLRFFAADYQCPVKSGLRDVRITLRAHCAIHGAYVRPPGKPATASLQTELSNMVLCHSSGSASSKDPVMETQQFEAFAVAKNAEEWRLPESHVRGAFALLRSVLEKGYAESMRELLAKAARVGESLRFAGLAAEAAADNRWSRATVQTYFRILKRVLREATSIDAGFVNTAHIARSRQPCNLILGRKYGSSDASNAPARARLEHWVEVTRSVTRNRSDASLRNVMSFYVNQCLPRFGLRLEDWPADPASQVQRVFAENPNLGTEISGSEGVLSRKKTGWLNVLLGDILGASTRVSVGARRPSAPQADDGADVHRISSTDLEKIHLQSQGCVLDELLFTLMLTTGLRVGAVAHVLTSHIADVVDHRYVVRIQCRTREKGNKCASFILTPRVQVLVRDWLSEHRPAIESPYLFPGAIAGGHITTTTIRARFAKLCAAAGLSGPQFHPHALRHTCAHLLLETGNSVDIVSKILNHSSSAVTEQFYLKESAAEVMRRADIPWLRDSRPSAPPPLPAFLGQASERTVAQGDAKRRKTNAAPRFSLDLFAPAV